MKQESFLFLLKRNWLNQPADLGPPLPSSSPAAGGVSPGIPPLPPTFLPSLGSTPQVWGTVEGTAWRGGRGAQEPSPGLREVSVLPAPCTPSARWASLLGVTAGRQVPRCGSVPARPPAPVGGHREGQGSRLAALPPSPLPVCRMGRGAPGELARGGCALWALVRLCNPEGVYLRGDFTNPRGAAWQTRV